MTGDVTIKNLKDNPGLYPLNLGNAILKESEWTLIKIIDYTPIIISYDTLRDNLMKTISTLENQNFFIEHRQAKNTEDIIINHNNLLLIIKQYIRKNTNHSLPPHTLNIYIFTNQSLLPKFIKLITKSHSSSKYH